MIVMYTVLRYIILLLKLKSTYLSEQYNYFIFVEHIAVVVMNTKIT